MIGFSDNQTDNIALSYPLKGEETPLKILINLYEKDGLVPFKPTKQFYEKVGIEKKRFWQLVAGIGKLDAQEVEMLAWFFDEPIATFHAMYIDN